MTKNQLRACLAARRAGYIEHAQRMRDPERQLYVEFLNAAYELAVATPARQIDAYRKVNDAVYALVKCGTDLALEIGFREGSDVTTAAH